MGTQKPRSIKRTNICDHIQTWSDSTPHGVCVWKGYGLLNNSGSVDVDERKQGGEQQKFKHTMARKFFIDHLVVGVYF